MLYLPVCRKTLEANYRGMVTPELQEMYKKMFKSVWFCEIQCVGGYDIHFHREEIYAELVRREAVPEVS